MPLFLLYGYKIVPCLRKWSAVLRVMLYELNLQRPYADNVGNGTEGGEETVGRFAV
jgi:hypothetical protein